MCSINGKCLVKKAVSLVVIKELRTLVAMLAEDKDMKIFFMSNDFCLFFDAIKLQYVQKSNVKGICNH